MPGSMTTMDAINELPIFAAAAPAVRGSRTSNAAARSLDERTLNAMQRQVLEFLRQAGDAGATDEEIQIGLPMNPSSQRPRRGELVDAGLVVEGGTRKTRSGRLATVWRVAGVLWPAEAQNNG